MLIIKGIEGDQTQEGNQLLNYKGIYFNDDENQKYTCPITGAHFEFTDMCRRIKFIQAKRVQYEHQLAELSRLDEVS